MELFNYRLYVTTNASRDVETGFLYCSSSGNLSLRMVILQLMQFSLVIVPGPPRLILSRLLHTCFTRQHAIQGAQMLQATGKCWSPARFYTLKDDQCIQLSW